VSYLYSHLNFKLVNLSLAYFESSAHSGSEFKNFHLIRAEGLIDYELIISNKYILDDCETNYKKNSQLEKIITRFFIRKTSERLLLEPSIDNFGNCSFKKNGNEKLVFFDIDLFVSDMSFRVLSESIKYKLRCSVTVYLNNVEIKTENFIRTYLSSDYWNLDETNYDNLFIVNSLDVSCE